MSRPKKRLLHILALTAVSLLVSCSWVTGGNPGGDSFDEANAEAELVLEDTAVPDRFKLIEQFIGGAQVHSRYVAPSAMVHPGAIEPPEMVIKVGNPGSTETLGWRLIESWQGPSPSGNRKCYMKFERAEDEALFLLLPQEERREVELGSHAFVQVVVTCFLQ